LDERTVKTVAKMGDYVMGERPVQRETSLSQPFQWLNGYEHGHKIH